jgi:hypothetical protein
MATKKKAVKRAVKKASGKLVIVEVPLPDGWVAMYAGRLVSRNAQRIVLTDAAWVANTGRRHLFFAGTPDANCEIEPTPQKVRVDLPAVGAIVTEWPHAALTQVR